MFPTFLCLLLSFTFLLDRNDYFLNRFPPPSRSNDNGFDFASSLNVIQWISMLQELYEKFDYNDLECQKRLICEVMKEPEAYGATAMKFKTGFQ